ncbi:hypothetical protein SEA_BEATUSCOMEDENTI_76 [Arthrobacter phage BeatusComedenti]|uniref:Uncharacterized protein n=1 Tax=Arthrobacter phage BeatusComedenti TaxID=2656523 RepID=A0A649VWX7_9CAUD|nr:hypothetical protein SEA_BEATUSCOMEDENTI_76 [Arthrobacter phage BeatusComedenti]
MTPNERLEKGADLLRTHAADIAALLDGVRLNNPDNPRQVDSDSDPYEDEWYNIVGTPDFAYGRALKIADSAIHAATVPVLFDPRPREQTMPEIILELTEGAG